MKIKNITVENYRSIGKSISINTEPVSGKQASILLGINESGKSNLLEAIALRDNTRLFDYVEDCHSKYEDDEKPIKISYELDIKNSIQFYRNQFSEKLMPKELVNEIDITTIERKITISPDNERLDFFHVWIKDKKTKFSNFVLITETTAMANGASKKQVSIALKSEENVETDEDDKEINILDKKKLEDFIETNFFNLFDNNVPKIVFWKYEDEYLIQDKINLESFATDNSTSVPLKNCFAIAGIKSENIKDRIESIKDNSTKKTKLLKELSDSVTEHINTIWPDHKVRVEFDIDNMHLNFHIKDMDDESESYLVKQRSDGFKHFISILLNLSAENETGVLKNKLIILDEPEIHLHPSGEKYLKEELLKISKNNLVIFATHSIFMIDKDNLDRHYSVEKMGVETTIAQIERDNPFKEQVLYESLGTSILEHIENKVVIFEGKTDRDIFDLYRRKFKKEIKLPNLSLISADGVENVQKYTKFFNNNLIKGFVLVDSDSIGIAQRDKILKEKSYTTKNTFDINILRDTKKKSTLEDLFDSEYLEASFSEVFSEHTIALEITKPYLEQIVEFCKTNKLYINKDSFQNKEKEAKLNFFNRIRKLKKEDLEKQAYYKLFDEFSKKIK